MLKIKLLIYVEVHNYKSNLENSHIQPMQMQPNTSWINAPKYIIFKFTAQNTLHYSSTRSHLTLFIKYSQNYLLLNVITKHSRRPP